MGELAKVTQWRFPGVPGLECLSILAPKAPFERLVCSLPKLIHVERGQGRSRVGKVLHQVSDGDVIFIPPGEVHGGTPLSESGIALQVLILPTALSETLNGAGAQVRSQIEVTNQFRKVHQLARMGSNALEVEQGLMQLSQAIYTDSVPELPSVGRARLRRASEFIADQCFEDIGLSEIARVAELSRGEVCRSFAREFGMTPYAYKLAVRADRARTGIVSGRELGQLSVDAGYSDQAHFTRQFRRIFGLSPGDYSKRIS